jgi:integrase
MVYQRKDSPFWWAWLDGTRIRFSTKIPVGHGAARRDSRLQAQDVYSAAMGDLARGTFNLKRAKPKILFRDYAKDYRERVTLLHRSWRRESSMLRTLVTYFGAMSLSEIATHDVEDWKSARAKVCHRHTVNREFDVLKAMLNRAIPRYLDKNPAAGVTRFRRRPSPVTILSESAERALLQHASPQELAMVLLGLDALLRFSDVRTLRVEHDKGTYLEIVDPKTDPYKVPVSKRLRLALDALEPLGGFYFGRKYAGRITPMGAATAHDLFAGLCERARVAHGRACSGITFHALRHTGATRAARVVKLTVVQKLGGWSSLRQLERYDHPDDPESIRAVEAIGAARVPRERESLRVVKRR